MGFYHHMRNNQRAISQYAVTALRHGKMGRTACPDYGRIKVEMCYGGWIGIEDMANRFLYFAQPGERPPNEFYRPLAVNNLIYACNEQALQDELKRFIPF